MLAHWTWTQAVQVQALTRVIALTLTVHSVTLNLALVVQKLITANPGTK